MAQEVEFHTGVDAPAVFACRLLRKAVRAGARLVCTAPPTVLDEIDRLLWTMEERDFVPHVRAPGVPARVAERTPLWLSAAAGDESAGRVLVNVGADPPAVPANHPRVIEIVGADDALAVAGRERWRQYRQWGLEIRHHPSPPPSPRA